MILDIVNLSSRTDGKAMEIDIFPVTNGTEHLFIDFLVIGLSSFVKCLFKCLVFVIGFFLEVYIFWIIFFIYIKYFFLVHGFLFIFLGFKAKIFDFDKAHSIRGFLFVCLLMVYSFFII